MKFNIWLKWSDDRLVFQNLKEHFAHNEISESVKNKLWAPPLLFENNHNRFGETYLELDPQTSIMIDRNGPSKVAPFTQLDEARIYNSTVTEIISKTLKSFKFKCSFDMTYFPFDHQTCFVKVD